MTREEQEWLEGHVETHLEYHRATMARIESHVGRIDESVAKVRERVARVEVRSGFVSALISAAVAIVAWLKYH